MCSTIHTCAWCLAILFHLSPCILLPTTSLPPASQFILGLPHPYHRLLPHHSQCMPHPPIIFLFIKVRCKNRPLLLPLHLFRIHDSLKNVTYQRRHQKSSGKVQRYFPPYIRAIYNCNGETCRWPADNMRDLNQGWDPIKMVSEHRFSCWGLTWVNHQIIRFW